MEKKVYEFRSVTADNFDIEDCEVLVNKSHKYVKHVFNCEDYKSWYVCVTVFRIDLEVAASSCQYYTEDGCQYTDAFIPAYKDACAKLGIEPIIGEDDEEEEIGKTENYAEDMLHELYAFIYGMSYNEILEIRDDGFGITENVNNPDGSRKLHIMYNGVAMTISENTNCEVILEGCTATHDSYGELCQFSRPPMISYKPKTGNEIEEYKIEYPVAIRKMKTNVYNAIDGAMDCIGSEKVKLDFSKSEIFSIRSFYIADENCFIEKDDGELVLKSYCRADEDIYHEIRIKEMLLEEMLCVLNTLCDTPS